MAFQSAKREQLKALVAMMGASGSGKTFSSLVLAKGMIQEMYPDLDTNSEEFWNKIGVADTEHSRSKIYADMTKHDIHIGSFLHMDISPPFTVDKYKQAIKLAKEAGIEVLIIDSTSHLWKQLLQEQSDLGGRYQDWKTITPKYEGFLQEFVYAGIHIIATMRAKQEYSLERNELEKLEVTKLGTKPVQRDDFEYEFLTAFMFDKNHRATATKDNTPLFEELGSFVITEEHGRDLVKWLDRGVNVQQERENSRLRFIETVRQLSEQHEQVLTMVEDFEKRMKKPLEEFDLKAMTRVMQLVKDEVDKINPVD